MRAADAFDYDLEQVLPFMQRLDHGLVRSADMRVIGLRRRGELIAGVAYTGFSGHHLWMHVAGKPGARWCTREYRRACFLYPFVVCGVERVRGYVSASNAASRALAEHMGCTLDATLAGAAPDGGDVLIYVMNREGCAHV